MNQDKLETKTTEKIKVRNKTKTKIKVKLKFKGTENHTRMVHGYKYTYPTLGSLSE